MLKQTVTKKWKSKWMLSMGALLLPALLVSCSSDKGGSDGTDTKPVVTLVPSGGLSKEASDMIKKMKESPIELTVFGSHIEADFMRHYGRVINRTYPNIKFNVIQSKAGSTLPDILTAGTIVDIIYTPAINQAVDAGILNYDTTALLKKYNIDISKLYPSVQNVLTQENKGVFNPLAFSINPLVLMINKDVFDRFGVPYPKDGMTWNELLDIHKKITRVDNGVNYVGFSTNRWASYFQNTQYDLPIVNPTTGKAALGNKWTELFQVFSQFGPLSAEPLSAFEEEHRVAMYMGLASQAISPLLIANIKNYDISQFPEFPDRKGYGSGLAAGWIGVSSNSKQKEEALLAITELITLEGQTYRARVNGAMPTMDIPNIENILSADEPLMKGKNIKALFPKNYSVLYPVAPSYGISGSAQVNTAFTDVIKNGKDINTALREAEEMINQAIETAKATAKK